MSDQIKFSGLSSAASAVTNNASEGEPGQENDKPTFSEQVKAAVAAALEESARKAQSDRDKLEHRVTAKMQEVLKVLEAAKITPDENQRQVIAEAVRGQSTQEPDEQTAPKGDPAVDLDEIAARVMAEKGVQLMENDTEVAKVITDQGTEKFIVTLTEALNAKAERQKRAGMPLGAGSPPRPAHIGRNPTDVLDEVFSKYKGV